MRILYTRRAGLAALGATAVLLAGCTQLTGNTNVNTNINTNVNQAMDDTNTDDAMINGQKDDSMTGDKKDDGTMVDNKKDDATTMKGETKEFTVEGMNFGYDVKEIKVKKGDKVKIHFVNKEGFHDWRLDEFGVATPKINGGQTADVEFIADKVGTFEYYCSVGQHRAMGMVGKLIIE